MTEKPLPLLVELIRLVPAHGNVCDPFAGSGTTGEAAEQHQLTFIGMEWNADYWYIANKRLRKPR